MLVVTLETDSHQPPVVLARGGDGASEWQWCGEGRLQELPSEIIGMIAISGCSAWTLRTTLRFDVRLAMSIRLQRSARAYLASRRQVAVLHLGDRVLLRRGRSSSLSYGTVQGLRNDGVWKVRLLDGSHALAEAQRLHVLQPWADSDRTQIYLEAAGSAALASREAAAVATRAALVVVQSGVGATPLSQLALAAASAAFVSATAAMTATVATSEPLEGRTRTSTSTHTRTRAHSDAEGTCAEGSKVLDGPALTVGIISPELPPELISELISELASESASIEYDGRSSTTTTSRTPPRLDSSPLNPSHENPSPDMSKSRSPSHLESTVQLIALQAAGAAAEAAAEASVATHAATAVCEDQRATTGAASSTAAAAAAAAASTLATAATRVKLAAQCLVGIEHASAATGVDRADDEIADQAGLADYALGVAQGAIMTVRVAERSLNAQVEDVLEGGLVASTTLKAARATVAVAAPAAVATGLDSQLDRNVPPSATPRSISPHLLPTTRSLPASAISASALPPDSPYHLVQIDGKGYGLVASRPLKVGERILSETPLAVCTTPPANTPASHIRQAIQRTVDALDSASRATYNELCQGPLLCGEERNGEGSSVERQWRSNAFPISTEGIKSAAGGDEGGAPVEAAAVFPYICRINHACRPNAHVAWNEALAKETVHVLRPISEGGEILVSYLEPGMTRRERQSRLRTLLGFDCICELCSLGGATLTHSDERLRRIAEIDATMDDGSDDGHPHMVCPQCAPACAICTSYYLYACMPNQMHMRLHARLACPPRSASVPPPCSNPPLTPNQRIMRMQPLVSMRRNVRPY